MATALKPDRTIYFEYIIWSLQCLLVHTLVVQLLAFSKYNPNITTEHTFRVISVFQLERWQGQRISQAHLILKLLHANQNCFLSWTLLFCISASELVMHENPSRVRQCVVRSYKIYISFLVACLSAVIFQWKVFPKHILISYFHVVRKQASLMEWSQSKFILQLCSNFTVIFSANVLVFFTIELTLSTTFSQKRVSCSYSPFGDNFKESLSLCQIYDHKIYLFGHFFKLFLADIFILNLNSLLID